MHCVCEFGKSDPHLSPNSASYSLTLDWLAVSKPQCTHSRKQAALQINFMLNEITPTKHSSQGLAKVCLQKMLADEGPIRALSSTLCKNLQNTVFYG